MVLPHVCYLGLGFDDPPFGNDFDYNNPDSLEIFDQEAKRVLKRVVRGIERDLTKSAASMLQAVAIEWPQSYANYEVGEDRLLREVKPDDK